MIFIPSSPGYYLLAERADDNNKVDALILCPIIAWKVIDVTSFFNNGCEYSGPSNATIYPISIEDTEASYDSVILNPNGLVIQRGVGMWLSLDNFMTDKYGKLLQLIGFKNPSETN